MSAHTQKTLQCKSRNGDHSINATNWQMFLASQHRLKGSDLAEHLNAQLATNSVPTYSIGTK